VRLRVFDTPDQAAIALAGRIAAVTARPDLVLGLATGRSPIATYAELRRMHQRGDVTFARATTFNLDEFVGLAPHDAGSFRRFMDEHLFGGIDLDPARINFLDGTAPDLDAECVRYEKAIDRAGGIDLQLLGLGANGHIGFNEPAHELAAATHRVTLHDVTRRENAALFGGDQQAVPREALSMGMATILRARQIVLIATGARKAHCVDRMVRGPLTTWLPASFLQTHRDVELYLDRAAASSLVLM
jgi:glucosamine-6-phosphate deaminase